MSYDSWANLTNMFYIDQSVSTGFSQRIINVTNEDRRSGLVHGILEEFIQDFPNARLQIYSK